MRKTLKRNRQTYYLTCVKQSFREPVPAFGGASQPDATWQERTQYVFAFTRGRNAQDAQRHAEGALRIGSRAHASWAITVLVERNDRDTRLILGDDIKRNLANPHVMGTRWKDSVEEYGILLLAATKRANEIMEGSV